MPEAHSLAACTGRPAQAEAPAATPCSDQTHFTPSLICCPGTSAERGGLHTLFTMVLGGLVGATPHMISAAVMALVRQGGEPLASVGWGSGPWLLVCCAAGCSCKLSISNSVHTLQTRLVPLQARLLYEFAPVLAGLVPDLLPAVLMLLRTKAREVIKSVLGFVKVRAGGVGQLLLRISCGERV